MFWNPGEIYKTLGLLDAPVRAEIRRQVIFQWCETSNHVKVSILCSIVHVESLTVRRLSLHPKKNNEALVNPLCVCCQFLFGLGPFYLFLIHQIGLLGPSISPRLVSAGLNVSSKDPIRKHRVGCQNAQLALMHYLG